MAQDQSTRRGYEKDSSYAERPESSVFMEVVYRYDLNKTYYNQLYVLLIAAAILR